MPIKYPQPINPVRYPTKGVTSTLAGGANYASVIDKFRALQGARPGTKPNVNYGYNYQPPGGRPRRIKFPSVAGEATAQVGVGKEKPNQYLLNRMGGGGQRVVQPWGETPGQTGSDIPYVQMRRGNYAGQAGRMGVGSQAGGAAPIRYMDDWENWRDIPKNWLNEQIYEPVLEPEPPAEPPTYTNYGGGGGYGGWSGGYGSRGGYYNPYAWYWSLLNWRI